MGGGVGVGGGGFGGGKIFFLILGEGLIFYENCFLFFWRGFVFFFEEYFWGFFFSFFFFFSSRFRSLARPSVSKARRRKRAVKNVL